VQEYFCVKSLHYCVRFVCYYSSLLFSFVASVAWVLLAVVRLGLGVLVFSGLSFFVVDFLSAFLSSGLGSGFESVFESGLGSGFGSVFGSIGFGLVFGSIDFGSWLSRGNSSSNELSCGRFFAVISKSALILLLIFSNCLVLYCPLSCDWSRR